MTHPHGEPFAGEPDPDRLAPNGVPHDLGAEQAVIGAALLNAAMAIPAAEANFGGADDFYRPAHATIWRTITSLHRSGEPVDMVTVVAALTRAGVIEACGGALYIHTCASSVPTAANAGHYAQAVAEQAYLRRTTEAGVRLVQVGGAADAEQADAVVRAELAALTAREPAWPDPLPIGHAAEVPAFPTDALPSWVGAFVAAVAEETQTPPDLAGSLALSCLAAAAGGRAVVEVRGQWREPLNLFTAVALGPGNRKSAVFDLMVSPLLEAEEAMVADAKRAVAEASATARVAREAAERAATKAANAEGAKRAELTAEAVALAHAAESATVPVEPQLIGDDATPETVATLLAEQGGRIAVMSAEGGVFDIIAGRYSGVPNMDVYLKGHAGDMLKVNRRSRREYVRRPALTIGLACQPEVFRVIGQTPGFEGRGLLARFLYSLPESRVGRRTNSPDPIPAKTLGDYRHNLACLTITLADWTDPAVLPITPQASELFTAYQDRIEPQLAPDSGTLGHIAGWGSKLPGAVARIAGLLHLAGHLSDGWGRAIGPDTMRAAISLGDYFTAHAVAVFNLMGTDASAQLAGQVLDQLGRFEVEQVSAREIFTKLNRRAFPNMAVLEPVLNHLEDLGWIRREAAPERRGAGRRPSPRYRIHPTARTRNPQNQQKPDPAR